VDVSSAFNLWMAVKGEGTLWAWGRNAHFFTGVSQDACETPTQVGRETNWQSVCSSGGGFYHLLRKRDGSFWLMDATESNHTSVKLSPVKLPPDVIAYDAGGGAIAAITRSGEVWTCGTVLGQHNVKDRLIASVQKFCWRLGWRVRLVTEHPKKVVDEKPWQLRNIDPSN
jgi:alpha-tubulin suppressor-like RCC1 family protein